MSVRLHVVGIVAHAAVGELRNDDDGVVGADGMVF